MNITEFNDLLQKYSSNLGQLKVLRSFSTEQIFVQMTKIDIEGNGYITREKIIENWCKDDFIMQETKMVFVNTIFAVQKISYSLILKFFKGSSKDKSSHNKSNSLQSLISSILSFELNNSLLQKEITKNINLFVPMKYSKPSKQELCQYSDNQQINIDIEEMAKSLNLIDVNIAHSQKAQINFQETLCDPSVSTIDKLTKRIQNRIDSFGKQWLMFRQQQATNE